MKRTIYILSYVGILLFMSPVARAANIQYTYDNLNRVTRAAYNNGIVIQYAYDANGNRVTQAVIAPSGSGACGSANGRSFLDAPESGLCGAGKASEVTENTGSESWNWTCAAVLSGGITVSCSANVKVEGVCGTSNGQSFLAAPMANLCKSGTVSSFTGMGPWDWICDGENGGRSAKCSAKLEVDGACGPANGQSFPSEPTSDLCNSGSASAVKGKGPWKWTCTGLNGGTKAGCTANLEVNGACGSSNGGTFTSAPTTNLCNAGTATAVTGGGSAVSSSALTTNATTAIVITGGGSSWNWACMGLNGGANASCSANTGSGSGPAE